jgi:hypothetical protein
MFFVLMVVFSVLLISLNLVPSLIICEQVFLVLVSTLVVLDFNLNCHFLKLFILSSEVIFILSPCVHHVCKRYAFLFFLLAVYFDLSLQILDFFCLDFLLLSHFSSFKCPSVSLGSLEQQNLLLFLTNFESEV